MVGLLKQVDYSIFWVFCFGLVRVWGLGWALVECLTTTSHTGYEASWSALIVGRLLTYLPTYALFIE